MTTSNTRPPGDDEYDVEAECCGQPVRDAWGQESCCGMPVAVQVPRLPADTGEPLPMAEAVRRAVSTGEPQRVVNGVVSVPQDERAVERYEGEPDACHICGDTDAHPLMAMGDEYWCSDCYDAGREGNEPEPPGGVVSVDRSEPPPRSSCDDDTHVRYCPDCEPWAWESDAPAQADTAERRVWCPRCGLRPDDDGHPCPTCGADVVPSETVDAILNRGRALQLAACIEFIETRMRMFEWRKEHEAADTLRALVALMRPKP